jgi:hypothetical protein
MGADAADYGSTSFHSRLKRFNCNADSSSDQLAAQVISPTLEPGKRAKISSLLAVGSEIRVGAFRDLSPRYKGGNVTYGLTFVTYVFDFFCAAPFRSVPKNIRYISQTIRYLDRDLLRCDSGDIQTRVCFRAAPDHSSKKTSEHLRPAVEAAQGGGTGHRA